MIIRGSEVHEDVSKARLGVALAAEALGVECDCRLTMQWLVRLDECERAAFLELACEEALKLP